VNPGPQAWQVDTYHLSDIPSLFLQLFFHIGPQFLPRVAWTTILLPMPITKLGLQLGTAVVTPGLLVEMESR
jgi:hypothetical protein